MGKNGSGHLDKLLDQGWNLLLFPEGTRTRDGGPGRVRRGAAVLAAAHNLSIVPIRVTGTRAAMPPGRLWPKRLHGKVFSKRHRINVSFGEPIRPRRTPRRSSSACRASSTTATAARRPRRTVRKKLVGTSLERLASAAGGRPRPTSGSPPQPGSSGGKGRSTSRTGLAWSSTAPASPVAGGPRGTAPETSMTKQADFKRRVRERMARTGESYTAARGQLLARSGRGCRDAARDQRRLDGAVAAADRARRARRRVARRAARGPGARRRRRGAARRAGAVPRREPSRDFEERDAALAAGRDGEYVLWFEADLYDQLQIAQILARLAELRVPAERITLICIGEYLGIAHFGGLGELRPDQLEGLPRGRGGRADRRRARARRAGVGGAARARPARARGDRGRALARAALHARGLRSPRPRVPVDARRPVAHRAPAARRDRRGRRHGGRGVRPRRGAASRARSSATPGPSRRSSAWRAPRSRCSARARAPSIATPRVALTEAGRRVLDGAADHVALNGIDRWIGGVHLVGRDARVAVGRGGRGDRVVRWRLRGCAANCASRGRE